MNQLIKKQLSKHKIGIAIYLITYITEIILSLLEPVIFGKILDMLISHSGTINDKLIQNIILLCIVLISSFILYCISRRVIYSTGRKVKQGIYTDLIKKFEKSNISFFESVDKGTFVSYIINDINSLWSIIGHGAIEITRVVAYTVIGFIISMKYVNFSLSISVFIVFPIFIYLIIKQSSKVEIATKEIKELNAMLSKKINDGFCGFTVIKSYVKEQDTIEQFNDINKKLKDKNIHYNKVVAKIDSISTICQGISFSIACIYGIYLVMHNVITIGSFIAFNSIIQKIISDYIYAGNLVRKVSELKIINKRIQFLYNTEVYSNGKNKMPRNPNINIKNLNYRYSNEKENTLENINLNIPYGSFIGILGKTGSGKTTLANIITKFYEIDRDIIKINDVDINDIDRYSFYDDVAYVMQEDYIYDNTIKYNVELGKEYDGQEVEKALEKSEFLSTVNKLPEKRETCIGESGIKISGGQKQRLLLARNLITKPKILIIDNGLTGLDMETRKRVIEKITNKNKDMTLIIISNMIEDITEADKIYILEEKTLKEINLMEVQK
jgi:ATP-binding cassette subfamily B multidrug efflux pump